MDIEDQPTDKVLVALSGGSKEDAGTIFGLLRTAYPCDRAADDLPQDVSGRRPTVWTATFDAAAAGAEPGPRRLGEPVTATLQGGYIAVDTLRKTLAAAFAVRLIGTASGDQEEEVQLKLDNK